MKKYGSGLRVLIYMTCCIFWIGLLYPEFAMPSDSYRIVTEEVSEEEMQEWAEDDEVFWKILSLDKKKLRIRSYFFRFWNKE